VGPLAIIHSGGLMIGGLFLYDDVELCKGK